MIARGKQDYSKTVEDDRSLEHSGRTDADDVDYPYPRTDLFFR